MTLLISQTDKVTYRRPPVRAVYCTAPWVCDVINNGLSQRRASLITTMLKSDITRIRYDRRV